MRYERIIVDVFGEERKADAILGDRFKTYRLVGIVCPTRYAHGNLYHLVFEREELDTAGDIESGAKWGFDDEPGEMTCK